MHHRSLSTTAWLHRPRISSLAYLWRKTNKQMKWPPKKNTKICKVFFCVVILPPKELCNDMWCNMEDFLGLNVFSSWKSVALAHVFYRTFFLQPMKLSKKEAYPIVWLQTPCVCSKTAPQKHQSTKTTHWFLLKFWSAYLLRSSFSSFHPSPLSRHLFIHPWFYEDEEIILLSHCWTKWLVSARMEALIWV